jgi:hypothetical protein
MVASSLNGEEEDKKRKRTHIFLALNFLHFEETNIK